jgi:hypothetical protein
MQSVLAFMSVAVLVVVPVLHNSLSHEHHSIASSDADSNACFVYSDGSNLGSPASDTCPICVTSSRARSLLPTVADLGVHSVPQRPRLCLREVPAGVGIPSLATAPPRAPPLST